MGLWTKIGKRGRWHVRTYALIATVILLNDLPFFWKHFTNDGYGIYTAPDDIEAPPRLKAPWPPILVPEALPEALPRLSAAELETYFFPKSPYEPRFDDDEEYGGVIQKFGQKALVLNAHRADHLQDDTEVNLRALYESLRAQVPRLPPLLLPAVDGWNNQDDRHPEIFAVFGWKTIKRDYRILDDPSSSPTSKHMTKLGCAVTLRYWSFYAKKDGRSLTLAEERALPPTQAYRLHFGGIGTRHLPGEPTVDHCLFKALLVSLGLHPTEGFFFKSGPVTPPEQARALAALALLYHPAITPGMNEQDFTQTLLQHNLIDP